MRVKPIEEREDFIRQWLEKYRRADIMDRDFVRAYADFTGAKYQEAPYGAGWCRLLSRDLTWMFKSGQLKRTAMGIHEGYAGMPNWVYSYRLPETDHAR